MERKSYRILIIGSCVTRDIFRTHGTNVIISDYFARTSIPSLTSLPLVCNSDSLGLDSQFQKKNVIRDFDKSLWIRLKKEDYDLVLIDLIDERFDLIKLGDTIITRSNELNASGYIEKEFRDFQTIKRADYPIDQWEEDSRRFIGRMEDYIPKNKLVLIEAFWATNYRDQYGKIRKFEKDSKFPLEHIERTNELLMQYYKKMEEAMHGGHLIKLKKPIADEKHIWGLSPFHYSDDWYEKCRDHLDRIAYDEIR